MCCHGLLALHRVAVGLPRFVVIAALVIAFIVAMKVLRGIIFVLRHGFSSRRRWSGTCPRQHEPPRPASKPAGSFRPQAPPMSAPRYVPPPRFQRSGTPSWSLLLVALFFFCLVALGLRIEGLNAPRNLQTSASPTTLGAEPSSTWTVTAFGKNEEDARQVAMDKAYGNFLRYLANLKPAADWQPPSDYLQNHLQKHWKEVAPTDDQAEVGATTGFELEVQVTAKDREEIATLDHQARRENRQFFLAKILAALVALFTVIAGYVRLDEWSKGYYTGWLRLATAGFIGAVGAAAWVWMRHV